MNDRDELIITFLFGWLGIHKFIKRKYAIGILYLLTGGLFLIGWIIDLVIIIKNILNKRKNYSTPIKIDNNIEEIQNMPEETNNNTDEVVENKKESKNRFDELLNYVYATNFHVVGITFENRTSNLKKIIKNHFDNDLIEKYDGMKPKEIKESYEKVGEYENQYLSDTILKPYKYQDEDAIRVKVNNLNGEYLDVGNVPKEEVKELIPYLNNEKYRINISSKIVGGKYKEWDDVNEEWIYDELNYGIEMTITVYNK